MGEGESDYGYDEYGRLETTISSGVRVSLAYDEAGNRTAVVVRAFENAAGRARAVGGGAGLGPTSGSGSPTALPNRCCTDGVPSC